MIETLQIPPQVIPVSLETIKETLRLPSEGEDARLRQLIKAATEWVEGLTQKALITQTRLARLSIRYEDLKRDRHVRRPLKIRLPTRPLIRMLEVRFEGQPLTAWRVTDNRAVLLHPLTHPGELTLLYEVGYGPTAEDVPAALRQVVLMAVVRFYEQLTYPTPEEVSSLITPFKPITIH